MPAGPYGTENSFLTNDEIATELLRRLENDLVASRLVNRNNEGHFNAGSGGYRKGDTINVKKPHRVRSAEGRHLVVQPMGDQVVPFTLNRHRHVGLNFTIRDRMLNINEFSDRILAAPAAELGHHVDYSILEEAVKSTFNASGTPNEATSFQTIIRARAAATMLGVPTDGMVRFCLNPLDAAENRIGLTNLANEGMVKTAIERSSLGSVAGMSGFETAQMPMHTVGAHGSTPTVKTDDQTGSTLVITTSAGGNVTGFLKKGDIFTIGAAGGAGVFSVNPASYQSTGMLQQFVVLEDADLASNDATLSISPAINDGTLTALDEDGNPVSLAAYQNVTQSAKANMPITVLGGAGSVRRENLMLHRDAVTLCVADGYLPQTAPHARKVRSKSGLSLTMTADYNIADHEETYRIDVLWGVHNLYPDLSFRVFGTASS